jgi:Mg2+-importing ATPase
VVHTGLATQYGEIAKRLTLRPVETAFERGLRQFGYLLTIAMLVIVLVVFVTHIFRGRPPVETLLFSVALAVGLSPELLPAILTVNLARGARSMASHGVLVRRLNAIENLGSMDILCTDKTAALTEGVVELEEAMPGAGPRRSSLELAACNARARDGTAAARRRDPAPAGRICPPRQDFRGSLRLVRKRVTVAADDAAGGRSITKGAFHQVLQVCTRIDSGRIIDDAIGRPRTPVRSVEPRRHPRPRRGDAADSARRGWGCARA